MKVSPFSTSNFRVISQDKQTVKNQYDLLNFTIFHHEFEIASVTLSTKATVADLMSAVRHKLSANKKFPVDKLLFLESLDCREVLDYSLQIGKYGVRNYADNQRFKLVMREEVHNREEFSLSDFEFKRCLGQGASATVFLVRHRGNGRLYAMKQIQKSYFVEFKRIEQVLRQRKIMTEIIKDFPYVAKLFASFESQKHLNFLLQFYPGGEMFFHLQRRRLSEQQAKLYFSEMVLTFEMLHKNKIIYRDLKPQNIMIDFNGHARLSDFGLCKINLAKDDLTSSYCGSIEYMAPEIKQSQGYNYSVDFYTLGAFLYQMVMGIPPYYNGQGLFFGENSTVHYKTLVKGLIQESVSNRIDSFALIKSSKWLDDVDWPAIAKGTLRMPFEVEPYQSYIHEQFRNVTVADYNSRLKNYDKLFGFFNFIKIDKNTTDLIKCYSFPNEKSFLFARSGSSKKKSVSKKKQSKDKSINNKSKQLSFKKKTSSRQKSTSSSRKLPPHRQPNIYTRRTREQQKTKPVSPNPTTQVSFKRAGNLKQVKSSSDLMKNLLSRP